MAGNEKRLAASSLIPLEVDPTSILSLSKGVIFDTIVHNIEYTLNNRRDDPLPWKLTGMSLICDPSRNKNYMHKLQKMQCVPSVICTQIYHSKLIKTDAGVLTTPGKKIVIRSSTMRRLTGVFVCRSIDELLYMEPSNTESVHYIQYKLLSYERLATRELVNGPKLTAVGDRVIKTVFDFELSQYAFPRQLLPVAIISLSRETGGDLCRLIRNFLNLDDHKIFDKSYLVTSTNIEFDRLREEEERKQDAEAEQESLIEDIQRRQPLADLSKKSTDTENAQTTIVPPSRPPIPSVKIKLNSTKPSISTVPLDRKFHCSLKLDRVNLSSYDISNLPNNSQVKNKKPIESTASSSNSTNPKIKPLTIMKPHEHHKPLKRLNTSEPKKQISSSSDMSKDKRPNGSLPIHSSTSDVTVSTTIKESNKERSISSSSLSPIYRAKPPITQQTDKPVKKKKVIRPALPSGYRCSVSLPRIDLSLYNLDLPPLPSATSSNNNLSSNTESVTRTSPSSSSSSFERQTESSNIPVNSENAKDTTQQTLTLDQESNHEFDEPNLFDGPLFEDINTNVPLSNTMDEFLTPDLDDALLNSDIENDLSSTNEIVLQPATLPTDISSSLLYETVPETNEDIFLTIPNESSTQVTNDIPSEMVTEVPVSMTNEVPMEISNEVSISSTTAIPMNVTNENLLPTSNITEIESAGDISEDSSKETTKPKSPTTFLAFSPTLPPLDDDPILFSFEPPQLPIVNISDPNQQEFLIIVPCSDDEDDFDDEDITLNNNHTTTTTTAATNNTEKKPVQLKADPYKNEKSPILSNPLLSRVLTNINRLNSDRLSISSSSSCSSVSTSILLNQFPQSPLQLTEILLSQKALNKKQRQENPPQKNTFHQLNISIPLLAHEPLIDPRLIYRLQAITTDLRWPTPCNQCSISERISPPLTTTTQAISTDRNYPSDCVDPRRESLKNAILNTIYQRLHILIPNIFIINSNEFQKLLFEQTIFHTNCSLHLEDLSQKLKQIDDMDFFQLLRSNEEFRLSTHLLQLIFN